MLPPKPTDFGLSDEMLRLIDGQLKKGMAPRSFFEAVAGLVMCLILFNAIEDTGLRLLFIAGCVACAYGALTFCLQRSARLLRGFRISGEDWANHARYRTHLNAYLRWKAEARKREEERRQQEHEARRRRLEWWQQLDGRRFEKELAALLERYGYTVKRTGGPGDEGVDLLVQKSGDKILVQCKAHGRAIGPGAVRDLYGAMMHHGTDEAWLVSSRGFSYRARKFASNKPISLLTIKSLLEHPETLL